MVDSAKLAAHGQVQLPPWRYIGGQLLTNPSGAPLTIPSTAKIVEIASEDDKTYWSIGNIANVNSFGYVPADSVEILGPLSDDTVAMGIWVHGPAAIVHITYWRGV